MCHVLQVSVERDLQEKLTLRGSAAHTNGNQPASDKEQPRVYKHFTARGKTSHLAQVSVSFKSDVLL